MSNSEPSTDFDEFFSENNFYSAPSNNSSNHINKLRSSVQIPNSLSSRSIKDGLRVDNELLTQKLSSSTSRTSIIKSSPSLKALESILNEKSKNRSPGTLAQSVTEEEEEEEEGEQDEAEEKQFGDDEEEELKHHDPLDIKNKYSPERLSAPVNYRSYNATSETVNSGQTFETADEAIGNEYQYANKSSNKRASNISHKAKSSISTISGSGYSTDDTPILGQPPTFQNFTQHNFDSPQLKVIETGAQHKSGSKDDTLINDTTESQMNDITEETVSVDLPEPKVHKNSFGDGAKERNKKAQNNNNFSNTTNNFSLDKRDKKLDHFSNSPIVESPTEQRGGKSDRYQHQLQQSHNKSSRNFKSAFAPLSKPAIPPQNNNSNNSNLQKKFSADATNFGNQPSAAKPQDFNPDMNYEPYTNKKPNSKEPKKGDIKQPSMLSVLSPNEQNLQNEGRKNLAPNQPQQTVSSQNKSQPAAPTTPTQRSPHLRSNSTFSLNFNKKTPRDDNKPQLLHKRSSTMDDLNKVSNGHIQDAPAEKKKFSFRSLFKSKSKSHELNKAPESSDTRAVKAAGKSYSTTNIPLYRPEESGTTKDANRTDLSLPPLTKTKSNISIMSVFKKNKSSDKLHSLGKTEAAGKDKTKAETAIDSEAPGAGATANDRAGEESDGSPVLLDERFAPLQSQAPSKAVATPGSVNFIREVSDSNLAFGAIKPASESSDTESDQFEDADEDANEDDEEENDDKLSFDPSADEKFDVYDSKNLQANPPVQRLSNHKQGEEISLIPPLIQDTQFGSPFKVDYQSSPDAKRPGRNMEANPLDRNSIFANSDNSKQFSASMSPSASPVPKRYPSRKEDKSYQLLGESLFPRSLSAHEVESIVSLERSRSLKSIKSNKRSSFVNYDGSDDNIVHYSGPTLSPHNPSGITRSSSILKNSTSKPSNLSKELDPPSIDANILDDNGDDEGAMPNSSSVYSQAADGSLIKSQSLAASPRPDENSLQYNLMDTSDYNEFMEFSDFIDVDNLTFNYSPAAMASASASPRPDVNGSNYDVNGSNYDVNERLRAEVSLQENETADEMVDTPDIRVDDDGDEEEEGSMPSSQLAPPVLRIDTVDFPNVTADLNSPAPAVVESRTPSPSPLSMKTTESPKTSVELVDGFEHYAKVNDESLAGNDEATLGDSERGNVLVGDSSSNEENYVPIEGDKGIDDNATEVIKSSPILDSAYRNTKKGKSNYNNRPISMSFKGLNKPSFSGKIAQHDLRSSDSHQSFTISFNDDSSSVGGGFGTSSDDDDEDEEENEEQNATVHGDEELKLIDDQMNQEFSEYEKENLVPNNKTIVGGIQPQHNTPSEQYNYHQPGRNKTPPSKSRSKFGKENNNQNNSVDSSTGSYSPDFKLPLPPPPFGTKFSHNKIPSISDQSSTSSSPRSFTSMLGRWKRSNNNNNNANVLAPRVAPPPPVPTKPSGVRFSSRIILYDTYNDDEYDRHPDTATCNQLTPMLAQQIKEEMNMIKSEMDVHVESRCYTQFF
ncbi:BNI4 [Candida margitis]|uniref:BNI4 n=1 Tax=Candida margitis TaxID=1775924 RepID=UPI002226AD18|nr:BNI4 [Candida margitis]KAI5969479.1 BNI4 [Candida margitis]